MIIVFFIDVLDGNRQWNRRCCEMMDYLLLSFNSTFKMLKKTNVNKYNDQKYQIKLWRV